MDGLGPGHTRGRHHAGADLANDALPFLGILLDMGRIQLVQGDAQSWLHSGFLGGLAMASQAIAIDKRALTLGRIDWRGLAGQRQNERQKGQAAD